MMVAPHCSSRCTMLHKCTKLRGRVSSNAATETSPNLYSSSIIVTNAQRESRLFICLNLCLHYYCTRPARRAVGQQREKRTLDCARARIRDREKMKRTAKHSRLQRNRCIHLRLSFSFATSLLVVLFIEKIANNIFIISHRNAPLHHCAMKF